MEVDVPGPILRVMTEILRPVGRICHLRRRPKHGFDICCERNERRDEWIIRGGTAHRGEAPQLRTDDERRNATRSLRQVGLMQHHAAQRPLVRPRVDHRLAVDREMGRTCRSHKLRNLGTRRCRFVDRTRLTRRWMARDTAAPRIGALRSLAIRVGQRVPLWHIHKDEGGQDHIEPSRLQVLDCLNDGLIRRRAPVGRPSIPRRDDVGGVPLHTAD